MTPTQIQEFQKQIAEALAKNPDVIRYGGTNSADAILNAYMTNDWSGVTTLTGTPFSRKQQQEAVTAAERALNPAYKAQEAYDTSVVTDSIDAERAGLEQFRDAEEQNFGIEKDNQDQSAADQGVLFSGSRFQKLNDLRETYQTRDAQNSAGAAGRIGTTARNFQYKYGDPAAKSIRSFYQMPGETSFNPNVAGGKVTPSTGSNSVYDPKRFKFQGTAPVSQKAAVQTRAASLLGNRANKLSASGYKTQF
jgi:hypothetical protein